MSNLEVKENDVSEAFFMSAWLSFSYSGFNQVELDSFTIQ